MKKVQTCSLYIFWIFIVGGKNSAVENIVGDILFLFLFTNLGRSMLTIQI